PIEKIEAREVFRHRRVEVYIGGLIKVHHRRFFHWRFDFWRLISARREPPKEARDKQERTVFVSINHSRTPVSTTSSIGPPVNSSQSKAWSASLVKITRSRSRIFAAAKRASSGRAPTQIRLSLLRSAGSPSASK